MDDFREEMLRDSHISQIVDYPNASDCFPGVSIEGGVNYFIWDSGFEGDCEISTIIGDETISNMQRPLDEYDIFIRHNQAISILRKVRSRNEETLDSIVSSRNPFSLTGKVQLDQINNPDKVKIYANKETGYILRTKIARNTDLIDKPKVLISKAHGTGSLPDSIISRPIVAETPSACTETYLVVGTFMTIEEAENLAKYAKTRFFRFLLSLRKLTQNITQKSYAFIPRLDMKHEWTDDELYKRYNIDKDEQAFIKQMIKEME